MQKAKKPDLFLSVCLFFYKQMLAILPPPKEMHFFNEFDRDLLCAAHQSLLKCTILGFLSACKVREHRVNAPNTKH